MQVDEFYDMLPIEFWNKVEGFYELENMREKQHWERTRWSTCLLLNIHLGKGKRLKPKDLMTFDWERTEMDEKELQELKDRAEYMRAIDNYEKLKKDGE